MTIDLLVFSAEWCGPCKAAERAGVYDAVREAGYEVTKIDVDKQKSVADQFGVTAVPTYIIRSEKTAVRRVIGARDKSSLLAEIKMAENG